MCRRNTRTVSFLFVTSLFPFPSVSCDFSVLGQHNCYTVNTNCKCNSGRAATEFIQVNMRCIICDKTFWCTSVWVYVSVSVNLQPNYANLFQFLLLEFLCFCCTISLSHYYTAATAVAAAALGSRFYWWFTYQGTAHSSHTHKTQCAWLLHFIILFAAFVCKTHFCPIFIVDSFFQVRATIIMSSVCASACVSAYNLCSMVCWIEL